MDSFNCRSVHEYEKLGRLGKGTYGTVFRAKDKHSGAIVALKKLKALNPSEGFEMTSLREIDVLKTLDHVNIIKLVDIAVGLKQESVFLVFEYCPHDFSQLMFQMPRPFSLGQLKCILFQLLQAVAYLQEHYIVHRDLKLSNLLMDSEGILKLADFGLAKRLPYPLQESSTKVASLWYRAPELLLGDRLYSWAIDMWSVGCIFAEFWRNIPLFKGKEDADQLQLIVDFLGTPSEREWPEFSIMPNINDFKLKHSKGKDWHEEFPNLGDAGVELLKSMLAWDPARRIPAAEALSHRFFSTIPLAVSPIDMKVFVEGSRRKREISREHRDSKAKKQD